MTKYNLKKIAGKLYRDSYQITDGYHEIFYDAEHDKLSVAFNFSNSWSQDRSDCVGTMPGRITPTQAMDTASLIIERIEQETNNLREIK